MTKMSLSVGLDEIDDLAKIRRRVAKKLGESPESLPQIVIRKKSIDARGRRVRFQVSVEIDPSPEPEFGLPHPQEVHGEPPVVIIGAGPAGLFCAYQLARRGIASVIVERGKKVQPRRKDLRLLNQEGQVPADSNYCFGEGGAGTYSDGKLYTRSDKQGRRRDVLEVLALHGAPKEILVDARPHIGSNNLPKVITGLRERLEGVGVQFYFESRVTGLVKKSGRVCGVELLNGDRIEAKAVVVATGHSARDVFELLASEGVALEAKPFALGVRIEHPQEQIDQLQYGRSANHPNLPPAYYSLASTHGRHGVYSFCMCPGGWVVPASTEQGGLVVNGMSLSKRGSPYANSGLVVSVSPEDWEPAGFSGPLGGVDLQRRIEEQAAIAGGGHLVAPATRVTDLLEKRGSSHVPESSYIPGLHATNIAEVVDAAGIPFSERLRRGLQDFNTKMPGYISDQAVLIGVESRSSSPVRVPREDETLESPSLPGLYPCGEGAGYAGGIVSAALDGMRVAEAIERAADLS